MPIDEIESRLAELQMLQAAPVLYCRSGEQTKDLAAKLAADGMPISYLDGGVLSWEAAGLPVERP
jgi:thioredoxin 1/putative thioredoxin